MPSVRTSESLSLLGAATVAARLEDLLGVGRVSMREPVTVSGVTARVVARPADLGQLAAVLAIANSEDAGVCLAGRGSKLAWGNPPGRFDVLVSMWDLPIVCQVDADDLTLTASAATPLADAQAAARAEGRVLPLDGGRPARATVGGVVATADQGARGAAYGRVRDVVLGVGALLADGTGVRFGGRTMKNVAGYDVTKLFVGSFGVLGALTEITFRLLPRPDRHALLAFPLRSLQQAAVLARAILDRGLQPLVLEALSPVALGLVQPALPGNASPGGREAGVLLVAFAGHGAAVDRCLREARSCFDAGDPLEFYGEQAELLCDALAERGLPPAGSLHARASVPPSMAWDLTAEAEVLAAATDLRLGYRLGAARGTLDLWVAADSGGAAQRGKATETGGAAGLCGAAGPGGAAITELMAAVRRGAAARGGQLTVMDGLQLLAPGFDAWGEPPGGLRIMRGIKERLDPRGTLNPGRFVGGI